MREQEPADGPVDPANIRQNASTSATGFGLPILCIGAERGQIHKAEARRRVVATLVTVAESAARERGWCYDRLDPNPARPAAPPSNAGAQDAAVDP